MPVCDLAAGDIVHDREDDDPDDAVVVNTPPVPADEWESPGLDGDTVADDNPNYPADAPVAIVIYRQHLEEYDPDWLDQDNPDPIPVQQLREDNVLTYSFPAPRLQQIKDESTGTQEAQPTAEATASSTPTDDASQNGQSGGEATESKADDDSDSQSDEPESVALSPATEALKDRLEDGGMTVTAESDGETLRAEKLGEYYRVRPGEVLEGDGALRNRLEDVVTDFDPDSVEADHDSTA